MKRYGVFLAVLLLSGCAMLQKETAAFSCPKVGFIAGADKLSFSGMNASFGGFTGACSVDKARGEVSLDLALPFVAQKTDAALREQEVPYFIAVLSPEEKILQRQAFTTHILFEEAETGRGGSTEDHVIHIPLARQEDAHAYKVAIGFALTPEQLKQNKESK